MSYKTIILSDLHLGSKSCRANDIINFLENKMASSNSVESDNSVSEESSRIASQQLEEMSSRIVKLELELLTTKDHIFKLQSLALEQTLALRAATTTTVTPASVDI